MVPGLSKKQKLVVDAPLEPMAVVACAGSGKTKTAVSRLAKIRRDLGHSRKHVALLSFSNVAVDTFKQSYSKEASDLASSRVTIDTFDGFITTYILRPHAYRTMGCKRVPFLISGGEPFLNNDKYKYWYSPSPGEIRPVLGAAINDISVQISNDEFKFSYSTKSSNFLTNNGLKATKELGSTGGYTHELGKFWAVYTLLDQPNVLRALANRYSHIIVDEAQDIGQLHECILHILMEKGVKVSLIGDPNQAIYEFAGATGEFINNYNSSPGNQSLELDLNYRSIPSILDVANNISNRKDLAHREQKSVAHGAYYVGYDPRDQRKLADAFVKKIIDIGLSVNSSAILHRGHSGVEKMRLSASATGQGKVKLFAKAAIERDGNGNYQKSFRLLVMGVAALFADSPDNLLSMLENTKDYPEMRDMRLLFWRFLRSSNTGLPSAGLVANTEWHTRLKANLMSLIRTIAKEYGYNPVDNLGRILAKTALPDAPLIPDKQLGLDDRLAIRVDTVHQAKGESLDAVLYMAKKAQIEAMLNGIKTEEGRIGYVAVTRAKDLFVLAIPKSNITEFSSRLETIGLKKW